MVKALSSHPRNLAIVLFSSKIVSVVGSQTSPYYHLVSSQTCSRIFVNMTEIVDVSAVVLSIDSVMELCLKKGRRINRKYC